MMYISAGFLAGYPFRISGGTGNLSIQRHSILHNHIRSFRFHKMEKYLVHVSAFRFQNPRLYFNPVIPQDLHAFTTYQRVIIHASHIDFFNTLFHDDLCAGRRLSVMAARLQRHIEFCPSGFLATFQQGISLRMILAILFMIPFTDDLAVLHNNTSYHWIWRGMSLALFCQFNGSSHILFFVHISASVQALDFFTEQILSESLYQNFIKNVSCFLLLKYMPHADIHILRIKKPLKNFQGKSYTHIHFILLIS